MPTFEFTLKIEGHGKTVNEAWNDALRAPGLDGCELYYDSYEKTSDDDDTQPVEGYKVRQRPDRDEDGDEDVAEYQARMQQHYDSYNDNQKRFVQDMESAGIQWDHYRGRWSFEGPAAHTSDRRDVCSDDIIRATRASLGRESLGLGLVIWAN